MACTEITQAIQWAASGTATDEHPVTAYFTKHFGYGGQFTATKDSVHYAVGSVGLVKTPTPHLAGTLNVYKNGTANEGMVADSSLTYAVMIFDDGTLTYQQRLHGNPIGGLPPTKVAATCVNNDLLTAISGGEVVALGVARKPAIPIPT
jgi:hypothetical protein